MNKYPDITFRAAATHCQRGLTLVELLVSLVLVSLITIASAALYNVSASGYRTVDANQELQDSGRFALEVIGQAVYMAGYQNFEQRPNSVLTGEGVNELSVSRYFGTPTYPPISGANNAKVTSVASVADWGTNGNGGVNASDTLATRFHGYGRRDNPTVPDGTIVDCQGVAQGYPLDLDDVGLSLFWVRTVDGEPTLECISRGDPTGTLVRNSQPIVKGVESFQVVYGLSASSVTFNISKWVSAQDMVAADWEIIRAVRVGLILRGAPGSAQSAPPSGYTLYPLGEQFSSGNTEAGVSFAPPDDGRLRKVFTATFKTRNPLNKGEPQ